MTHYSHSIVPGGLDVISYTTLFTSGCGEAIFRPYLEKEADDISPPHNYEGADLPLEPSVRGWGPEPVRQLRDPCVFEENGKLYLLYSVAGEHGIALARLSGL